MKERNVFYAAATAAATALYNFFSSLCRFALPASLLRRRLYFYFLCALLSFSVDAVSAHLLTIDILVNAEVVILNYTYIVHTHTRR